MISVQAPQMLEPTGKSDARQKNGHESKSKLKRNGKRPQVVILRPSDIALGSEVGRGGFCSVREVYDTRVPLELPPHEKSVQKVSKNNSENTIDGANENKDKLNDSSICNDIKRNNTRKTGKFWNPFNKKNKKSSFSFKKKTPIVDTTECPLEDEDDDKPSYVIKLLRNDLSRRALLRGRLDLCIEAAHLLSIHHKNVVRVAGISRGIAKYLSKDPHWKNETEFFLVLERLEMTLDDMIKMWVEDARREGNSAAETAEQIWQDTMTQDKHKRYDAKLADGDLGMGVSVGCGGRRKKQGLWSKRRKKREERQRWLRKLEVARDIAVAVRHLHEKNIIYRDLKPSNIGISYNGTTTLFDFGLAKTLSDKDKLCNSLYRMTGHTGSLRYMAPEVALNLPYNSMVDSYSFAMLLWQICSFVPPFLGFSREKHQEMVIKGGWRPPTGKRWPKACVEIIESCWSDNLSKRMDFSQIEQLLNEEIERFKSGGRK